MRESGLVRVVTRDGVVVWTSPVYAERYRQMDWRAPVSASRWQPYQSDPRSQAERVAALAEYRKRVPYQRSVSCPSQ